MTSRRYTVSDIVATVYCEQKVVFDRQYGKARPAHVARKAVSGTFEHLRFEVEGYSRNPVRLLAKLASGGPASRRRATDSRCFVATQVYGPTAAHTDFLRAWRDRVLMTSFAGRAAVAAYYALSPMVAAALRRSPFLQSVARRSLDAILRRLGGPT